jgi:hypothetical protein
MSKKKRWRAETFGAITKKKIEASRDSTTRPQDSRSLAYIFVVFLHLIYYTYRYRKEILEFLVLGAPADDVGVGPDWRLHLLLIFFFVSWRSEATCDML